MRVGIVTPRYPPNVQGGGEVSARMLAEHLCGADRIGDVVVLSFDGVGTETRNGVEVRRLADVSPTLTEWQNAVAYRHLRDVVDEFDVVHAYNMELHPAVGALADRTSAATVATLNSYHFLPKSVSNTSPGAAERIYETVAHPTTGRLFRYLMNRIDAFVAISRSVRDIYTEYGLDSDRITVIPNMIDPSFSVPAAQSGNGHTVLYVGELSRRKGVGDLVAAMGRLPSAYNLRIVGDGAILDELRQTTTHLELDDQITFTGQIPYEQIPREYARADVFVHPGVWPEPFGRTVLEAMQAGLPVVCTDVGGPADVVREAELRCEPGDPDGLAAKIEFAYSNRAEIGDRNRKYVVNTYSPSTVTARTVELYESVMRTSGPDAA